MNTHTAAELILKKHIEGCQWYAPVCDNRVLAAMEEYAASLSAPAPQTEPAGLEFYKWAHKQGLERYPDDLWRYETDMLQAASMDEDESWDNGLSKEEGITTFTDEQVWQKFLSEAAAPVASHSLTSGNPVGQRIYTASKTKHAHLWTELRAQGYNVISTWIDEAGAGQTKDMSDLCRRCIEECMSCDAMLVYSEEGDYLKGAFIEMGVALAANKPIVLVGPVLPSGSAFTHASKIYKAETIQQALSILSEAAAPVSQPAERQETFDYLRDLMEVNNLNHPDELVNYFLAKRERVRDFLAEQEWKCTPNTCLKRTVGDCDLGKCIMDEAQPAEGGRPRLQWVKASERLPEKWSPAVIVRHIKTGEVRRVEHMGHFTNWGAGFGFAYAESEWLEESPSPVSQPAEGEAFSAEAIFGYPEWLIKNEYFNYKSWDNEMRRSIFKKYLQTIKSAEGEASMSLTSVSQERIGGYAPGNYFCSCVVCHQKFIGDKRAVQCYPCAKKLFSSEREAAPEDWKRLVSKENLMCLLLKYDRDKNKCADKIIKLICAPLHTQLQAAQAENERLKGEAAPQDRRMLLDQIQHILITHRGHAGGASEVYDNIVAPLQSQLQAREKEAAFLNEKINEYSTQLQAAQERVAEVHERAAAAKKVPASFRIASLHTQLQSAQAEREKLVDLIKRQGNEIGELKQGYAEAETENREQAAQLQQAEARIKELEAEIKNWREAYRDL